MQNVSGYDNVFMGYYSGYSNYSGNKNSFYGVFSGRNNYNGIRNTFNGYAAGYSNVGGGYNVYMGYYAGYSRDHSYYNVAIGAYSGKSDSGGNYNTLIGYYSGYDGGGHERNTFVGAYSGHNALGSTSLNKNNTFVGYRARENNTYGAGNVFIGSEAGDSNTEKWDNVAIGYQSDVGSSTKHSIAIGAWATVSADYEARIGSSSMTSIGGQVSWSTFSDGRFKENVKSDVPGLDFILELNPVTYNVNHERLEAFVMGKEDDDSDETARRESRDENSIRHSGLIAQEVEEVLKEGNFQTSIVETPQNENDPYGIRYAELVIPLIKAIQELSAKVEEQQKLIENYSSNGSAGSKTFGSKLFQNRPNPFSSKSEIQMKVPERANDVQLIIYNLEGKQLKSIPIYDRGSTSIRLTGNELGAGIYLYTLIIDNEISGTKRMIITR